jgi:single-stranded-DNA-specific exonuclease
MEVNTREWLARSEAAFTADGVQRIEELQKETGLSAVTLRVCLSRGLTTAEEIQHFLLPKLEHLKDPLSIRDMEKGVTRLVRAKQNHERVRVFGDYDVDGTTGAALLTWFFRDCDFIFDATQPDRFKDGYGLNLPAIEQAYAEGVKVLVTVDCGITSFEPALRARELGIDLIILDHHQVDPIKGIPKAYAVINPQRTDCESGLKELCGCGVAFYLIRAIRSEGRKLNWWKPGLEPNLKQHLDLVVMATAADMVPLVGDNHILARRGLEVLKTTSKPGVKALLEAAGVGSRELSPSHLGFTIGPRINASGRMSHASHALSLLTTQDSAQAAKLAHELERLNQERADLQNKIWDQVRLKVEAGLIEGKYQNAIMVGDPSWHEGVVGIVASKVTETFKKPAAVLALRDDFAKGSIRSFGGKNILEAIRDCEGLLLGFGGHKYAAGLSVSLDNFEKLVTAFDEAVGRLEQNQKAEALLTEGAVDLSQLSFQTLQEIEKLGPFGPGNPEPVFEVKALTMSHSIMKGRHLKMNLTQADAEVRDRVFFEAVWFHAAEREDSLKAATTGVSLWAAVPEINRFRGRATATLRVKDRKNFPSAH